jgi:catechol 2,3-dioxygenase-like lactoylglutathione lyase family enzyme
VQVIFAVSNLADSLDFYERGLGWPRNERIDYTNYVELLAPDGGALGLFERAGFTETVGARPADLPEDRVAPAYLYARVDDVEATAARLEAAGGPGC